MSYSESNLQASCVIQFSQKYPDQKGNLIGYFATSESQVQTSQKLSLGLVKNCSDLLYIKNGELIGIELKLPESRHDRLHLIGQASWLLKTPKIGWFCDSLEMFWEVVDGGVGINPQKVLDNCLKIKTKTVSWNEIKF